MCASSISFGMARETDIRDDSPPPPLGFFNTDLARRKSGFILLFDFVKAGFAVEHLQDGKLLLLEAEIIQPDRFFHDPVRTAVVELLATR